MDNGNHNYLTSYSFDEKGSLAYFSLISEREYKMYMENERKKKQRASGKPRCKME
jgi:hypothetical protein